MAELNEIMVALVKIEGMVGNLTRPSPTDDVNIRSHKEHSRWMLTHTLTGLADDLAEIAKEAARKPSDGSNSMFLDKKRRN